MSFGSGGEIRYNVVVDARQAVQQFQSLDQQFQTLGTSTQTATEQVNELPPALDNVKESSKSVEQQNRNTGLSFKQSVLGITTAVSSVIGLVQQYTQLKRAQNTLEKAHNTEIQQRNKLNDLREKERKQIDKYGKNSKEAEKATRDRQLAEQKLGVTVEKNDLLQEQYNQRLADFATNIVPQVIGIGSGLAQVVIGYKQLGQATQSASIGQRLMGSTLFRLGVPLAAVGGALLAVKFNIFGARDAVNALGDRIGKAVPQLKPLLNAIKDLGTVIGIIPGNAKDAQERLKKFGGDVIQWGKNVIGELSKIADKIKSGDIMGAIKELKVDIAATIGQIKFRGLSIDQITTGLQVLFQHRLKQKGAIVATFSLLADIGTIALNPSQNTKDIFKGIGDLYTKEAKQNPVTAAINLFTRVVDFTVVSFLPTDLAKLYVKFTQEFDRTKGQNVAKVIINIAAEIGEITGITEAIKAHNNKVGILRNEVQLAWKKQQLILQNFIESNPLFGFFQKHMASNYVFGNEPQVLTLSDANKWFTDNIATPALAGFLLAKNTLQTAIKQNPLLQKIVAGDFLGAVTLGLGELQKWFTDNIEKPIETEWNNLKIRVTNFITQNPILQGIFKTGIDVIKTLQGVFKVQTAEGAEVKTDNKDILARQAVQLTKDNNQLAKTIVQLTKDNNQLAKTVVQVTKDYNQEARTINTVTKDNNSLAKTIVTITKDNNTLAKTIVTLTKDYSTLARAIVTVTKDNNQLARTTVTVGKDFNKAADDAKSFAKSLIAVASAAKKAASAIRNVPSGGPNFQAAAIGFHGVVTKPTMFLAGESGPEAVNVSPLQSSFNSGGNTGQTIVFHEHNHFLEREVETIRKIENGRMVSKFGG